MAKHGLIVFILMIFYVVTLTSRICVKKWVDFPYFPFFDKNV